MTTMDFAKTAIETCPELLGLDDHCKALLMWRCSSITVIAGQTIYLEGDMLDNTFSILLSGSLLVEVRGRPLGFIKEPQLFGEMAYFTQRKARTASVIVDSTEAEMLVVKLGPDELLLPDLKNLRKFLGNEAWKRFVANAKNDL